MIEYPDFDKYNLVRKTEIRRQQRNVLLLELDNVVGGFNTLGRVYRRRKGRTQGRDCCAIPEGSKATWPRSQVF